MYVDFEQTLGDSEGQRSPSMGSERVRHDLVTEQRQQDVTGSLNRLLCRM